VENGCAEFPKNLPATSKTHKRKYALVRMIGQVFTQSEDCIYPSFYPIRRLYLSKFLPNQKTVFIP